MTDLLSKFDPDIAEHKGLLETIRDWEVDLDGVERNQLVPTRGVAHAPIAFTPVTA